MLFDDLPEVKKGGNNENNQDATLVKDQGANGSNGTGTDQPQEQKIKAQDVIPFDGKKTKSIVESLGSAGTTMAFVPAALRKRKATASKQIPARRKNASVQARVAGISTTSGGNIHEELQLKSSGMNATEEGTDEKEQDPEDNTKSSQEHAEEEYKEPQELTDLHASIRSADMYDPMAPNDYLAYKQRKENESLQADIQRQARKTLEMQQKLRSQIESERRKALASGDLDKIIESRSSAIGISGDNSGRGRGRGRGMSNLPAWLIKKQQEGKAGLQRI
jgi:hypothetical protein